MVSRSSSLFSLQFLVLLCGRTPVAFGGQWVEPPLCLSAGSGLSMLQLAVFLSVPFVVRAVISDSIIVVRSPSACPTAIVGLQG